MIIDATMETNVEKREAKMSWKEDILTTDKTIGISETKMVIRDGAIGILEKQMATTDVEIMTKIRERINIEQKMEEEQMKTTDVKSVIGTKGRERTHKNMMTTTQEAAERTVMLMEIVQTEPRQTGEETVAEMT